MANISGAVQIETGIKHGLSIPVQSVAVEQSIDVGTLLTDVIEYVEYRRDLRHGPMELFKAKLAQKILSTYRFQKAILRNNRS
jgi:hypothetical protein